MRLYSAKVRLGGLTTNEVLKTDLTAPEVLVLRFIHGDDAVVNLVCTGEQPNFDHHEERKRLEEVYTSFADEDGKPIMPLLFGALYAPLPTIVPGAPTDIVSTAPARVGEETLASLTG